MRNHDFSEPRRATQYALLISECKEDAIIDFFITASVLRLFFFFFPHTVDPVGLICWFILCILGLVVSSYKPDTLERGTAHVILKMIISRKMALGLDTTSYTTAHGTPTQNFFPGKRRSCYNL